jgi:hypothetical protein
MRLRITEAQNLCNAIQEAKNIKEGKPAKEGLLKKEDLAVHLFPDVQKETAIVNMSNISRGRKKAVKQEHIIEIADFFGVDCNFLIGVPSVYDELYLTLFE